MVLKRRNMTNRQARCVIEALVNEAVDSGLPEGTPLCRFGLESIIPMPAEEMMPVLPFQPQWGMPSQYENTVPADIFIIIKGLKVSLGGSSWVVYLADEAVE